MCIGEPREDEKLLCSDGELIDIEKDADWSGCFDRGSVRVQCPKDYYPCNKLRKSSDYKEFICAKDCSNKGGKRDCNFHDF